MKKKVAIKSSGALGARSANLKRDRSRAGKHSRRRGGQGAARKRIGVLVVYKSLLLREAVGRFLQEHGGFEVVGIIGEVQAAVLRAAEPGVDLVLMDVHMAQMDGLEATRRIKKREGAPVVILCALDDGGHVRAAAKAAGADAFVPKAPRMFTTLPAAIRSAFPGVNLR
jgi:DNA-binding NarL/FixJ family response regulator